MKIDRFSNQQLRTAVAASADDEEAYKDTQLLHAASCLQLLAVAHGFADYIKTEKDEGNRICAWTLFLVRAVNIGYQLRQAEENAR